MQLAGKVVAPLWGKANAVRQELNRAVKKYTQILLQGRKTNQSDIKTISQLFPDCLAHIWMISETCNETVSTSNKHIFVIGYFTQQR